MRKNIYCWTLVFKTPMIFVHHDFHFQKFEDLIKEVLRLES